jgi:transposase
MSSFGRLLRVGVEGTGVYGAGLARLLSRQGVQMIEVDRPDRKTRRSGQVRPDRRHRRRQDRLGRRAARDAQAAQRPDRSGQVPAGGPPLRGGPASYAQRQIKALIVTAPDELRQRLRALPVKRLIVVCASLRPDRADTAAPATATKIALRSLARRHQRLTEEINDLDELLEPIVAAINPRLAAANGVGTDVAGQLLVTAGDNHDRLTSEAAFAMLCGAAPIPASSGKTNRHRLNRGDDRQVNKALYQVVICRLRWDPRTRAYMERRTKEGFSKKEIIRCLKRYVARELYQIITATNDQQLTA